jgi:hypothetical protein
MDIVIIQKLVTTDGVVTIIMLEVLPITPQVVVNIVIALQPIILAAIFPMRTDRLTLS